MPELRIGTSGWSYDDWQGVLYPRTSDTRKRLAYYVRHFDTVELNSSFYHWPRDSTFTGWRDFLPDGFQMTVKAPRALTHAARLHNPERWVEIVSRGMKALKEKAGVFLVQLPPDLEYDRDRLGHFLSVLPESIRVSFEFRHPSWVREETFALLAEHNAAYCVMSGAKLPCELRATADFVYIRLHGPDKRNLYAGSYSEEDMRWWADRMEEWRAQGRDVYAYFNNDYHGNAVRNADVLRRFLAIDVARISFE